MFLVGWRGTTGTQLAIVPPHGSPSIVALAVGGIPAIAAGPNGYAIAADGPSAVVLDKSLQEVGRLEEQNDGSSVRGIAALPDRYGIVYDHYPDPLPNGEASFEAFDLHGASLGPAVTLVATLGGVDGAFRLAPASNGFAFVTELPGQQPPEFRRLAPDGTELLRVTLGTDTFATAFPNIARASSGFVVSWSQSGQRAVIATVTETGDVGVPVVVPGAQFVDGVFALSDGVGIFYNLIGTGQVVQKLDENLMPVSAPELTPGDNGALVWTDDVRAMAYPDTDGNVHLACF